MGADRVTLAVLANALPRGGGGGRDARGAGHQAVARARSRPASSRWSRRTACRSAPTQIHEDLRRRGIPSFYDETGSIGRRYRRQDETGTPFCITIDGETMEQGTVTVRDRDTMEQTRLSQDEIVNWLGERING